MYAHPEFRREFVRQRGSEVEGRLRRRVGGRQQVSQADGDGLGRLVEAARGGDQQAWELLFRRFTPKLRGVVRGYRLSDADVEDVVQATWAAAFSHIDRIRVPEAFGGWLLVTARYASLHALERNRREIVVDHEHLPEQASEWTPESALLEAEQRAAVEAAVERLPARQGTIMRALFLQSGTSYADLCDKLGIPLGSIGPTRERALNRLREDEQLIATI